MIDRIVFTRLRMKLVLMAGGLGTRLSEETQLKPKPMVEIGGKPILWHIMKIYSFYGINEFIICCGYKGYVIKEYFANYFLHTSDVTISMKTGEVTVHGSRAEPWKVTLADTGNKTQTGGRLLRIRDYLEDGEDFCMTYGDGLADIDISKVISFHNKHKELCTMSVCAPSSRFGAVSIDDDGRVSTFIEKPDSRAWVNAGFFVVNKNLLDCIDGDSSSWESDTLPKIVKLNQLQAYKHHGFWQPMDTLREKHLLETLWNSDSAPWRVW